eukprot:CAMPEP_0181200318 /NCGR_PEP_ID=MMETSP1096-20121128/17693_1 /TAXON_ID=156174 ORGANISM="Chrysochromulina ericina, Strain CCMP281" /NCGR_SAMPLE_ID=MMETSP1096 /ASSEMBLY_ACC=CAM_ASM_000453 /LENGTH=232 /DNA_ID=CAMNT_0023290653 /DNA_START=74 /DNA_END=772 /DNA_ORIENTATION=+
MPTAHVMVCAAHACTWSVESNLSARGGVNQVTSPAPALAPPSFDPLCPPCCFYCSAMQFSLYTPQQQAHAQMHVQVHVRTHAPKVNSHTVLQEGVFRQLAAHDISARTPFKLILVPLVRQPAPATIEKSPTATPCSEHQLPAANNGQPSPDAATTNCQLPPTANCHKPPTTTSCRRRCIHCGAVSIPPCTQSAPPYHIPTDNAPVTSPMRADRSRSHTPHHVLLMGIVQPRR